MHRRGRLLSVLVSTALVATSGWAAAVLPPAAAQSRAGGSDPRLTVSGRPVVPQPQPQLSSDISDGVWPPAKGEPPAPRSGEADVPPAGVARVGDLPVWVGRPATGTAPQRVRVRLLDQAQASAMGSRFVALALERADGASIPAAVTLVVDYAGLERSFGGNFARRLRLVSLPRCAATTPDLPECVQQTVLPTSNDVAARTLTVRTAAVPPASATTTAQDPASPSATVPAEASPSAEPSPSAEAASAEVSPGESQEEATLAEESEAPTAQPAAAPSAQEPATEATDPAEPVGGDVLPVVDLSPGVVAMSSGGSSGAGDYSASPLTGSGEWQAGGSSGNFSWTYPIPMPPSPAGQTPELTLAYSSQAVDGRTSAENGQPSQVGEGWTFTQMFIERKHISCSQDGRPTMQDLCYQNPEYFLNFNGVSSELVRGTGNDWRVRNDPAWRIRSFTGASNGDSVGDYWQVLTPDGTEYYFGYGREPVTNDETYSAWTVPVFGDDAGEPCYNATLANAWCMKAWRWNLDRIVDPSDNVTTLFWAKEKNYYSRQGVSTAVSQYDRGGYLDHVQYGERKDREHWAAPAYVDVITSHRCVAQVNCGLINSSTDPQHYPDVPMDLFCWSSTNCAGHDSPSFFTTEKIFRIKTWVRNNDTTDPQQATYSDVDELNFYYSFPANPDGTDPALWLTDIGRDGLVGTRVTMPLVNIGGSALRNRVNPGSGEPALYKWRVTSIEDELGATVHVTYGQPHPCNANTLPTWHTNTTNCFKHKYKTPSNTWVDGAFNKYLTTQVEVDDTTVPDMPTMRTTYAYQGTPAWHYDDALYVPASEQSWSDWRGYGTVQVESGSGASRSISTTTYFRGMNGDKADPTGTPRVVSLTDSEGGVFPDQNYLAGSPLESARYTPAGSAVERTLHRYWAQNTVLGPMGYQQHNAQYVRENRKTGKVRDTSALVETWRSHRVDKTFGSTYAHVLTAHDHGNTAVTGDETCESNEYAVDAAVWIIELPYVTRTYAGNCSSTIQLARTEIQYDGQPSGTGPVRGLVTVLKALTNGVTAAVTTNTYDALGRITQTIAPNEFGKSDPARTTTTYDPASGYPYNGVTTRRGVTNANPAGILSEKVEFSFAWGVPHKAYDANNQLTTVSRDAVGRIVSVQRPEDPAGVPGIVYEYSVSQSAPSRVKARKLLTGTTYVDAYTYLDSFGRTVESQSVSPASANHRIVSATRYDDQGRVVAQSGPMHSATAAGSGLLNEAVANIPSESRFTYDHLGRQTTSALFSQNVEQWRVSTAYSGWKHTTTFPVRDPMTYAQDVFGRTTSILETYPGGSATTTFAYTRSGELDTITDDLGNVWNYDYDWLGRRTLAKDPDQGTWTTAYDVNGNVVTSTDAKTETLWHGYDALNRRTETRVGSSTGTKLATWTYDDAAITNGKGALASATRIVGGHDYTVSVPGYDGRGRPTGKKWTIPSVETGFAPTYEMGFTYDHADNVRTVTYPSAGGLPAETVTSGYSTLGLPTTLTSDYGGGFTYVESTDYDTVARPIGRGLGATGVQIDRTYEYELATDRLSFTKATLSGAATGNGTIDEARFAYDDENNVRSVKALTSAPGATAAYQMECFQYDQRNRLLEAFTTGDLTCAARNSTGPDPYDHSYRYDDANNLTRIVDNRAPSTKTFTYPASGSTSVRPHAVSSISDGSSFGYDANGATTTRTVLGGSAQAIAWDPLHQMSSVTETGKSSTFVYDADGARLIRRDSGATTVRTLYLDGMEIRADGTTVTATRYYGNAAIRTTATPGAGLHWQIANHQNSASLSVDSAGVVTRRRYLPFGGRRDNAVLPTERGFLNKVDDPTGLTSVGARYLDAGIGRFVSVDPLTDLGQPLSLNPYAYAWNNPSSLTDPSGLMVDSDGADCMDQECFDQAEAQAAQNAVDAKQRDVDEKTSVVKQAATEIVKIAADTVGVTVALDCFTGGGLGACVETAFNVALSFMGGVASKIAKKYGWPTKWGEGLRLIERLWHLVDKILDGVRGWSKAKDELKAARSWAQRVRLRLGRAAESGEPGMLTRLRSRVDLSDERGGGRAVGLLSRAETHDLANWLGYRPAGRLRAKGQQVFTNGKDFIAQDIDGHLPDGVWKRARTYKDLFSKQTRMGTFDYKLDRIGG